MTSRPCRSPKSVNDMIHQANDAFKRY
jgi:hypothetical protein